MRRRTSDSTPGRRRPGEPKEPVDPRAKALQLLSRREHSARELTRKLVARGVEESAAAQAVSEMEGAGWQDDARYAEMLVRSRVAQGFGPVRIQAELRQAGVTAERIQVALDEAGADWRELARDTHARHFGTLPRTAAERARHYRYLAGRGFDGSQIQAVLKGEDFD